MSKVTRLAAWSTLLALAFAATAFAAPKPLPEVTPLPIDRVIQTYTVGGGNVPNATCQLGVSTGATYLVNYVFPPNDEYYTLLDPSTCSSCASSGGAVAAVAAHAFLNFRTVCTQTFRVGVYGAVGDASCWYPDVNTVICAPQLYNFTPPAVGNYDIQFPLPAGCCFQGPVFLKIEFVNAAAGCNTSTTVPRLITTAVCNDCQSYNIYPGGGPDDLCYDIGFPGNPVMYLDVDCCQSTPTKKHSWGSLKSTYR